MRAAGEAANASPQQRLRWGYGACSRLHRLALSPQSEGLPPYALYKVKENVIASDVGTYKYSNFGYFLLSEIVKQRAAQAGNAFSEATEYVEALRRGLFAPLGVSTRPHPSLLGIENRETGEVVSQTEDPIVFESLGHNDGRWAHHAYGAIGSLNAATGTGAWAMAMVDLARVMAALRPSTASTLGLTQETLKTLLEPLANPLDFATSDPQAKVTVGGWDVNWLLDMNDWSYDLVLGKGGIIAGGSCVALIWNPQGPEAEIVTMAICMNKHDDGFPYMPYLLPGLRSWLDEITANNAWPTVDLFSEVVD